MNKSLTKIVAEAIGEASMLWDEGRVFEAEKAVELVQRTVQKLEESESVTLSKELISLAASVFSEEDVSHYSSAVTFKVKYQEWKDLTNPQP